jgi:hypothetical protein
MNPGFQSAIENDRFPCFTKVDMGTDEETYCLNVTSGTVEFIKQLRQLILDLESLAAESERRAHGFKPLLTTILLLPGTPL